MKKPARGRFWVRRIERSGIGRVTRPARGSSHRFNAGVDPALVTGRLIGMDQALAGRPVDEGHGRLEGRHGRFLVTRRDRLERVLDVSAHGTAARGILLAMLLGLTGALEGLGGVGQVIAPEIRDESRD